MCKLAVSELTRLCDRELSVDVSGWGWVDNVPLSPALVNRWEANGLIEDYSVGTKILTSKGERLAQEARVT